MTQPLCAGNAIRLFISPPAGAKYWRVLKAGAIADLAGPDDLDYALLAYEGDERVFVDAENLINEIAVFYKPFYRMADDSWRQADAVSATPVGAYEEYTTDAMSFLRDRLQAGLEIEVKRGNLLHKFGYVQVFTAPPSLENNLRFPLVTLTLDNESPAHRGIGEDITGDEFDAVGFSWFESEGWLSDVQITIVTWSQNSNERIEMRKAVRRIVLANLPIFEAKGISQISLTAQDVDAVNGEYGAQFYQTFFTFSCIAPVRVGYRPDTTTNIEVEYPNG